MPEEFQEESVTKRWISSTPKLENVFGKVSVLFLKTIFINKLMVGKTRLELGMITDHRETAYRGSVKLYVRLSPINR